MDGISAETFAGHIAAHCIAREGFSRSVPPEAAALRGACDIVLTRMHWSSFHVLCLVDGQAHPGKQFGLPPERVQEIAKACLKYCGMVSVSSRMPAVVEIVEISNGAPTDQDHARLKHFRRASIFSKGLLTACHVDATTRQLWRNRWQWSRTTAQRALAAPTVSKAELQAKLAEAPTLVRRKTPFVTWGILALLAAVFILEMTASDGATPSLITLISLGGINQKLVAGGEWWRAISATVLHANFNHLLSNGIALLIAGSVLENMVGRAWFAATYIVAALAGSAVSIALAQAFVVSVGASGAIMGVAAAATVCGLARRRQQFGVDAVRLLISVLIPTLGLAVWGGAEAAHIDHSAHFGGALGGAVAAVVMLSFWRRSDPAPRGRGLAAGVIGIGCLALAYATMEVAQTHPSYAIVLMPNGLLHGDAVSRASHTPQLVQQYPDDPRSYFELGVARLRQNDLAGAEKALRMALGMEKTLYLYFTPGFAAQIRGLLAATLQAEGNQIDAKEVAAPLCALPPNSPLLDAYSRKTLVGLCK